VVNAEELQRLVHRQDAVEKKTNQRQVKKLKNSLRCLVPKRTGNSLGEEKGSTCPGEENALYSRHGPSVNERKPKQLKKYGDLIRRRVKEEREGRNAPWERKKMYLSGEPSPAIRVALSESG